MQNPRVLPSITQRPPRRLARAIALALLVGAPAAADVTNPGFEAGPDPGSMMPVGVGSTAIAGWVVTRGAIDYCGTCWSAAEGSRSVALNGTGPGGIAQMFVTVPNAEYTVSFFMAGDPFSNPILKHLRVTAAAQSQDYEFDSGHAWPWGMGWLEKTFTFTAAGNPTTLEFFSTDTGSTGPALDQVRVQGPAAGTSSSPLGGLFLAPPQPNPMPDGCTIAFTVPVAAPIGLSVLDTQGRELVRLADDVLPAGRHTRRWDGKVGGRKPRAGIYLIRLASPQGHRIRKAALIR
jgi:choice-of-anchor C domain-containing protein